MPRGISAALSIAEIERIRTTRRSVVNRLMKKRAVIQRKLDSIDREMTKLGAIVTGRARKRYQ
jgi:hypothetical protein